MREKKQQLYVARSVKMLLTMTQKKFENFVYGIFRFSIKFMFYDSMYFVHCTTPILYAWISEHKSYLNLNRIVCVVRCKMFMKQFLLFHVKPGWHRHFPKKFLTNATSLQNIFSIVYSSNQSVDGTVLLCTRKIMYICRCLVDLCINFHHTSPPRRRLQSKIIRNYCNINQNYSVKLFIETQTMFKLLTISLTTQPIWSFLILCPQFMCLQKNSCVCQKKENSEHSKQKSKTMLFGRKIDGTWVSLLCPANKNYLAQTLLLSAKLNMQYNVNIIPEMVNY